MLQIILKGAKENSEENEFVPPNHGMIFIPLTIPPPFPLELSSFILPFSPKSIPASESSLNANVPEFHPREYLPKIVTSDAIEEKHNDISKPSETYIKENMSSTENNDLKLTNDSCNRSYSVEKNILLTSNNTGTLSLRKDYQMCSKADLNENYPYNVKSSLTVNNNKKSDKNRSGYDDRQLSSITGGNQTRFEKKDINCNNDVDKKDKCTNVTVERVTPPANPSKKSQEELAGSKVLRESERTYAQMLALIDGESSPIAANRSKSGSCELREKIARKTSGSAVTHLRKSFTSEKCISSNVCDTEWFTVQSKCRKKIHRKDKIDSQWKKEKDATLNPNIESIQINKMIDRSDALNMTGLTASIAEARKSKKSTGSKRKYSSKKMKSKTTVENFSITEPNFGTEHKKTILMDCKDDHMSDDIPLISSSDVILDPVLTAAPVSLLTNSPISSPSALRRQAFKAGLVGLNKCNLGLRQQFGLFQPESISESFLLKKEEEMVIRVLEQLSINDKCELIDKEVNEEYDQCESNHGSKRKYGNALLEKDATYWNVDRFSINAKPYQNSYSSNHFLGHFFGNNDDKRRNPNDFESSIRTENTEETVNTPSRESFEKNKINDCKYVHKYAESALDTKNEEKHVHVTSGQPRLQIVDTKILEHNKSIQQAFPITAAVSNWLCQAQKEETVHPILRMPSANLQIFNSQNDDRLHLSTIKTDSQENTDVESYSTDDSFSINNDENQRCKYLNANTLLINCRKHKYFDSDEVDDEDADDDPINDWESSSPTPYAYTNDHSRRLNYYYSVTKSIAAEEDSIQMETNVKNGSSRVMLTGFYNITTPPDARCNIT